ncbi:Cof-type HAD-IIB family hydrolase [Aerococcus sanguinicola]|uniref:Cof-type HAD-IIB family hydrolase n=1 Tax=unclassified Aerococcus TaxID=2618060 RepID=UPI0008A1532E|nr:MULTISPECIES: HAD family hydrolase [unclassified Aerococcus]KAB0647392.1 Cof-type HAD-IIB family hydrolase [Aerococcus sanguinicola]MDK6233144.1 HAD family hydrolase [Aerococcus sp. UMB10185]MDK6855649.1 HAD family hydrolase [Aerococcus sp. UMB7533]OFN00339.1 HAD family hydrolase [Aerococcus sp. HMSC062A02]OHO44953.1 HAD family hydrolase [Aerococcus sp. HMSC035B07]
MQTQFVFLDVDGTITNYRNEIPESAIQAIRQARANGHKVLPVTGRSKAEMYQEILDIGFDGYIGGNGSYIEYEDEVLYEEVLSTEDSQAIVDWLDDKGLAYYLESNNGLFASPNFEERGRSTMQEYAAYKGQPHPEDMDVRKSFPEMIFGGDLKRTDLNKVSFILESYDDYLEAKDKFAHLKVGTWGGNGEKALFGDIGVANITKAGAIGRLLKLVNHPKEATLAIGDAKIDLSMIDYCQVGVAVASGGPEIKEAADYVTAAVDDDGIYKAFQHFELI